MLLVVARERKPSLAQFSARIRSFARSGAIFFSDHALREMAKDGLDLADLLSVMGGCRIVEQQPNGRYRVEGRTANGVTVVAICRLEMIAGAERRVFVVTVWKVGTR